MEHPFLDVSVSTLFSLPVVQGDVGVELEIEGTKLPTSTEKWDTKMEFSLRGKNGRVLSSGENLQEDTPFEYITKGAYTPAQLEEALYGLNRDFILRGSKVQLGYRGSTHIHVNFTRETLRTVYGFIFLFSIIEPVLLRLCGPIRNGNLFCVPTTETGDLPVFLSRTADTLGYCKEAKHVREYWPSPSTGKNRGKYAAMNTDTLSTLGTLEIRCFPNEISPKTILEWVTWLLTLRREAVSYPDKTFKALFAQAYNHPNDVLSSIFPSMQGRIFESCSPDNPRSLILSATELAYESYLAMDELFDWKKPVKRKKPPKIDYAWNEEPHDVLRSFDGDE